MKFNYRFVPYGSSAPNLVAENEFWLDVGDRAAPQVLDHHGGDTTASSAFELILNNYEKFIIVPLLKKKDITFVLHASPDLDSICSVWLAIKIITLPDIMNSCKHLKTIEKIISENDQGAVKTDDPKSNWAIVMRTFLMVEYSKLDDCSKLKAGLKLVEKTYCLLGQNKTLEAIARRLISTETGLALEQADNLYKKDISGSDIFQTVLPLKNPIFNKTTGSIKKNIADAVILHNPKSILFKELARGDVKNSPQRQGFNLLVIVKDVTVLKDRILQRYIISTDPLSGFHLKGLGARLEELEQLKEKSMGLPLLKGRERLGKGLGRYGTKVKAPWYDGRGHNYTIVDSPAIECFGKITCASCLAVEEVKTAIIEFYK